MTRRGSVVLGEFVYGGDSVDSGRFVLRVDLAVESIMVL